jgi:diadenosine tetraphosphate (Ap4A) HIT family hydrolase
MTMHNCPFCDPGDRVLLTTPHWLLLADGFPATPGHALLVSRRHVPVLDGLAEDEVAALGPVLLDAQRSVAAEHTPDGWTVGVNDGPAAGQTVPHVHVHLIPRRLGDVPDPVGGVRQVVPDPSGYVAGQRMARQGDSPSPGGAVDQ